jgi:hypothetical protein
MVFTIPVEIKSLKYNVCVCEDRYNISSKFNKHVNVLLLNRFSSGKFYVWNYIFTLMKVKFEIRLAIWLIIMDQSTHRSLLKATQRYDRIVTHIVNY